MSWFKNNVPSSDLWNSYFDEFYWQEDFNPNRLNGFEKQVDFIKTLNINYDNLFFFVNVGTTHRPFRNDVSWSGQVNALEYTDKYIKDLIDFVNPNHLIITADHGECFYEKDGIGGHGFYHPKVMEVPLMEVRN